MNFTDLFAGIGGFRYGLESINRSKNQTSKEIAKTTSEEGLGLVSKTRKENGSPQRRSGGRLDERADQRAFTCRIGTNPQQGLGNQKRQYISLPEGRRGRKLQEFHCIYSNEWDKYASKIYQKNFGEAPDTRDIRTVPSEEIPDHDLLCAGFPCQSFSIAGKRAGFEDTRGTLFFEIARILRDKRPRHLLLENVKGLLSHQEGQTFQTILGVLASLGYRCEWQVLNSKHFGVPQNRERVFIVGHLGEESTEQIFPIEQRPEISLGENEKAPSRNEIATSLTKDYHKAPLNRGETYVIHDKPICHYRIRRLTPIECERLQGFEDNFTEGVSDTQRYKMLGNAVTTNVVEAIGRKLIAR